MESYSEKIIETQILVYLKLNKINCWKQNNVGIFLKKHNAYKKRSEHELAGISDIIGILPDGKFLAIEVKKNGGKLSPHQKEFINLINSSGGLAFVAKSLHDVNLHLA